jgi:hypothetical protein
MKNKKQTIQTNKQAEQAGNGEGLQITSQTSEREIRF